MNYQEKNNLLLIENSNYQLSLAVPPAATLLRDKRTGRLFSFVAGGDCALYGESWENNTASTHWNLQKTPEGKLEFCRQEKSSLWEKKSFCVQADEDSICFWHELEGKGKLDEVRFFRACYDDNEFGFMGDIDEIWSAAPNFREQQWYYPTSRIIITNGNDLTMCSGGTAIANVPHIMALHDRRDQTLLGAAIFAQPGEYLWDDMVWNPLVKRPATDFKGDQSLAGGFAIRYCGKKEINGKWSSPALVFTFPEETSQVTPVALEYAFKNQLLPRPNPQHQGPDWWREPIYCTWHDQCAMAAEDKIDYHKPMGDAGDYCTQELVEHWLQLLIDHKAKPGMVILDAKWQKSKLDSLPDPVKWPDMRGWIDHCHARGVKVILWGLAWHNEDIPQEEAITRDGKIVCGDITNPLYEARLRRQIRFNFSSEPGCLNADGVKIDGMMNLPTGAGLKNHKNIWGLELQRYLMNVIYDEAKKVKKEVLISTFAANPYLDEFTDTVRLADMYVYRPNTTDSMRWRANLYHCTNPGVPIDTDGQVNFLQEENPFDILDAEKEIGVPTIYNAEYIRMNHFFQKPIFRKITEEEYQKISQIFANYRKSLKG